MRICSLAYLRGTVLTGWVVPTMNFISSQRVCCMESDWVFSREVPEEQDFFRQDDNPTGSLYDLGWAGRSAVASIHGGCGGVSRSLFDGYCDIIRTGFLDDGFTGRGDRWAEVVLDGGMYQPLVTVRTRFGVCEDPLFQFGEDSMSYSDY